MCLQDLGCHPIPLLTMLPFHLPTGQAQTCPRGSPLPPAGVLTHLFTFGALPRTEQELHLTPGQCPLPFCPLPSLLRRVGGGLQPDSGASQIQFSSEGGLAPNTTKGKGCPWGLSDESRWTPLVSCPIELRARSGRPPSSKLVAFLMVSPVMFPAGSGEDTWMKEKLGKTGSQGQEGWLLAFLQYFKRDGFGDWWLQNWGLKPRIKDQAGGWAGGAGLE